MKTDMDYIAEQCAEIDRRQGVKPTSSCMVDSVVGFYNEVKDALYATPEFDSYECHYGFTLGECPNDDCLACRVKRALDHFKPNANLTGKQKPEKEVDHV